MQDMSRMDADFEVPIEHLLTKKETRPIEPEFEIPIEHLLSKKDSSVEAEPYEDNYGGNYNSNQALIEKMYKKIPMYLDDDPNQDIPSEVNDDPDNIWAQDKEQSIIDKPSQLQESLIALQKLVDDNFGQDIKRQEEEPVR